jgi:integrase
VVQSILGHSQVSFTLGTYSHAIAELQTDAAERMDALPAAR